MPNNATTNSYEQEAVLRAPRFSSSPPSPKNYMYVPTKVFVYERGFT